MSNKKKKDVVSSGINSSASLVSTLPNLEDEDWSCMVVILVESNPSSRSYIEDFERAAEAINHPVIRNVTPKHLQEFTSPVGRKDRRDASQIIKSNNKGQTYDALTLRKYLVKQKCIDMNERQSRLLQEIRSCLNHTESADNEGEDTVDREAPICGPSCYFVLTKFYEPSFPEDVIAAGIPLTAIYEVEGYNVNSSSLYRPAEQQAKTFASLLKTFWQEFVLCYDSPSKSGIFANTIILSIQCPNSEPFTEDKMKKDKIIHDQMRLTLYSLSKNYRNFIHYVRNAKSALVPLLDETKANNDFYNSMLDAIPLECTTVELVLHYLIEQVVINVDSQIEGVKASSELKDGWRSSDIISESLRRSRDVSVSKSTDKCNHLKSKSVFINHRNIVGKKCFHLTSNFENVSEIYKELYSLMPYVAIWKNFPEQNSVEKAFFGNQLQKLYSCIDENMDRELLNQCINLLSFKVMNRKLHNVLHIPEVENIDTTDKSDSTESKKSVHTETEKIREKQLNSLEKSLKCEDILAFQDLELMDLSSYTYYERLNVFEMLQSLNTAFYSSSNIIFEHCRLTDSILLWFQNQFDDFGISLDHKGGYLTTCTNFRDYYYTLRHREHRWIKNEEENILLIDEQVKQSWIGRMVEGIELDTINVQETKITAPYPQKISYQDNVESKPHIWVYSSLWPDLIHVSESIKKFHSMDGPVLTVKKEKWKPRGEWMTVILNSHGCIVTSHRTLQDSQNYNNDNTSNVKYPNSFHGKKHEFLIETKEGILFNVQRVKRQISKINQFDEISISEEICFDFDVTLPNGLTIQLYRGQETFVKQKYLTKHDRLGQVREEEFRIVMEDGTVLVFMENKSVLILYSNSTETRVKTFRTINPYYPSDDEEVMDESTSVSDLKSASGLTRGQPIRPRKEAIVEIYRHQVICPNGDMLSFCEDECVQNENAYSLRAATGNEKGLFTWRTDGTKCFIDTDGVMTTMFPDETVIVSKPFGGRYEKQEESIHRYSKYCKLSNSVIIEEETNIGASFVHYDRRLLIQHPQYATVEHSDTSWLLNLPHDVKLLSHNTNSFEIICDENARIGCNEHNLTVYSKNISNEEKETKTHFFLGEFGNDETLMCTVVDSQLNAFYVTMGGQTGVYNLQEKKSSHRAARRLTLSERTTEKEPSYTDTYLGKQSLIGDFIQIGSNVSLRESHPDVKPYELNRYFVLQRDLTGYEFIHETDHNEALNYYRHNQDPHSIGYNIRENKRNVSSQMPLSKTWSESWSVHQTNQLKSEFKKFEMSKFLPKSKNWLVDLDKEVLLPNSPSGTSILPTQVDWHTKPIKTFVVRNIYSITFPRNSIIGIFQTALNKYNQINEKIINQFIKNKTFDDRREIEVKEANEILERAMQFRK